jgi:small neutral amino acid transporter SnatA (MarC family)
MMALLLFLAGLACIVMGVTLISIPAAWITGGCGLIVMAIVWARGRAVQDASPPPALKEPPQRGSSIQNIGRHGR